jgi:hypothetical protein
MADSRYLSKGVQMHVTIRRYSGSPGLADALVARENEVRGLITAIDGFQAYYLIRSADGEATSISVYATESGTEESTRQAAEWLRENMPDLKVSPPDVTTGEAVLSF